MRRTMAKAQIPHHQLNSSQPQSLQPRLYSLQPTPQYTPQSLGYTQPFNDLANSQIMAQSIQITAQRQYIPNEFAQRSQWSSQPPPPRASKAPLMPDNINSNEYEQSLNHLWKSTPGLDQTGIWNHNTQHIVPELDSSNRHNIQLFYETEAAPNGVTARHSSYGGHIGWMPSELRGYLPGTSTSVSDVDSIISLSPQSYLSNGLDNSFSPGSVYEQPSLSGDWSNLFVASGPTNLCLPRLESSNPYFRQTPAYNSDLNQNLNFLGLPGGEPCPAGQLSTQTNRQGNASEMAPTIREHYNHGESNASMAALRSRSLWYMPGYQLSQSDMKLAQSKDQTCVPQNNDLTSSLTLNDGSSSSCHSVSCRSLKSNICPQDNHQPRLEAFQISSAEAVRQRNDELLIQGKREGLTYREIRNKMLGDKLAESTLRGRYRSLTKAKKDRVRRPVWHRRDIDLLNGFVGSELKRIEKGLPNPSIVSLSHKLVKVRWKEVADYIEKCGGSYHFGNSTCKRKWQELNPHAK